MHAEGAEGETLGRAANGRTTAEIRTERRDRDWRERRGDTRRFDRYRRLRLNGSEVSPPFLTFQAIRTSRVQREARQTVALLRRGGRPVAEVREVHARRTRPGSPVRAS